MAEAASESKFDLSAELAGLPVSLKLHFYEILAHELTIYIRGYIADQANDASLCIDRVRRINEMLHRVTAKVWVTRLKEHEWSDEDMWSMLSGWAGSDQSLQKMVRNAAQRALEVVKRNENSAITNQ